MTTRTSNYSLKPKVENSFGFDMHDVNPSFDHFSGFGGYTDTTEHYWPVDELSLQQCYVDSLPSIVTFPLALDYAPYASLDIEASPVDLTQDDSSLIDYVSTNVSFWSDLDSLFEPKPQAPRLLCNGETSKAKTKQVIKKTKKGRSEDKVCNSISKVLTREIISEYFYMPITQAAKELNVGLTLLKKRCRELGISRWPHRKLMSLQTLIKSLQNGEGSEGKFKEVIDSLERERKSLEEMPDMELGHGTKRLRQACFKANYKRRKLLGFMESQNDHSFVDHSVNHQSLDMIACDNQASIYTNDEHDEEDEEIKSLLYDSFSSDSMLLQILNTYLL